MYIIAKSVHTTEFVTLVICIDYLMTTYKMKILQAQVLHSTNISDEQEVKFI